MKLVILFMALLMTNSSFATTNDSSHGDHIENFRAFKCLENEAFCTLLKITKKQAQELIWAKCGCLSVSPETECKGYKLDPIYGGATGMLTIDFQCNIGF